jgi:hypothetical protein
MSSAIGECRVVDVGVVHLDLDGTMAHDSGKMAEDADTCRNKLSMCSRSLILAPGQLRDDPGWPWGKDPTYKTVWKSSGWATFNSVVLSIRIFIACDLSEEFYEPAISHSGRR